MSNASSTEPPSIRSGRATRPPQLAAFAGALALSLGALVALNVAVDVDGVRERRAVEELARTQGNALIVSQKEIDQRAWVRGHVRGRGCPKVLVLGSSTIGTTRIPLDGAVNAWLSAGGIEDYEGVAGVVAGCALDLLVVAVDPWFFNPRQQSNGWLTLSAERARARGEPLPVRVVDRARDLATSAASFVSWSTTKRTVLGLGADPLQGPRLATGEPCTTAGTLLRLPDGPFARCPQDIERPDQIERKARRYLADDTHRMRTWTHFDEEVPARLAAALALFQARRIVLVAPPYHPAAYAALMGDEAARARLARVDEAMAMIAAQTRATLVQARDPASTGCAHTEFLDPYHAAPSCGDKLAARILSAAP